MFSKLESQFSLHLWVFDGLLDNPKPISIWYSTAEVTIDDLYKSTI